MPFPATPLFTWTNDDIQTYCSRGTQLALALHYLIGGNVLDLLAQDYSEDMLISMLLHAAKHGYLQRAATTGVLPDLL